MGFFGEQYKILGDWEEILKCYLNAYNLEFEEDHFSVIINILVEHKGLDEALHYYSQAIDKKKNQVQNFGLVSSDC